MNCLTPPSRLAVIHEEGTPGGALFRAINVIADALSDEFPHVAIDTLAYQWSRPAPLVTVPRHNVIIRQACLRTSRLRVSVPPCRCASVSPCL